jgi:FMN phosphatase YigB (HAD superfamily)
VTQNNLNPETTFAIGDSIKDDVGQAKLAGLKTIWIEEQHVTGWAYENETHKPDYVVNNVKEIDTLWRNINGENILRRG